MSTAAHIAVLTIFLIKSEAARILAISQTPSLLHQELFHPLVKELTRRGHEVTFITTNPLHENENSPRNLKEIDLKELSHDILRSKFNLSSYGIDNLIQIGFYREALEVMIQVFEEQMRSDTVQNLIKHQKTFDLLLIPAWFRPMMIWSHIYTAPVIKLTSLGMAFDSSGSFGALVHPIFYPEWNLSILETFLELYRRFYAQKVFNDYEEQENEVVRRIFGPGVPLLSELEENVQMLVLNGNNFREGNRPMPRNVVYFRYLHQESGKTLPEYIIKFLDASQGSIFVNFVISMSSSHFPPANIQMLLKVFSELPYNILWNLDIDGLERIPENVVVGNWFSESAIFKHPNLKLIISQSDIRTTEQAIDAGVPLIRLRTLGDRWLNVQHYMQYGIGVQLDMESLDEEELKSSVLKVIGDTSYRDNIRRLRNLIQDTPTPALTNAILWSEYVLKYSDAAHLRSPAFNIPWYEYFEVELVFIIIASIVICLTSIWLLFKLLKRKIEAMIENQARHNEN